ncbi:MAG: hypothetical protein UX58_C0006G0003 [Candidatus Wolfebacteria bacterium GW2011_GWB2_46_69]|nr:MAG: hypothetical protein UX58_C0006G0003 [Candidatus Wolfebacteria bacterium GW2011_GWB2_46_69]KKU54012.1 MAG: hypothetical protein UX76_C0007G0071 [Candidatus Wolfebacteria bacterium GW2011_GWC1_47_103]
MDGIGKIGSSDTPPVDNDKNYGSACLHMLYCNRKQKVCRSRMTDRRNSKNINFLFHVEFAMINEV